MNVKIFKNTIYGTEREVRDYLKQFTPISEIQMGNYPCPYFGKSTCDRDCSFCMKANEEYSEGQVEVCIARRRVPYAKGL